MEDVREFYRVDMNGIVDPDEMDEQSAIKWAKEVAERHPRAVLKVLHMKEVVIQEVWTNVS